MIFFTNYGICIQLTTYVNYPCAKPLENSAQNGVEVVLKTRQINALKLRCLAGAPASVAITFRVMC